VRFKNVKLVGVYYATGFLRHVERAGIKYLSHFFFIKIITIFTANFKIKFAAKIYTIF